MPITKHIKTINYNTWEEFKELIDHSQLEWIYRGQSNSSWPINSTLYRSKIIDNFDNIEERLLIEFKRAAFHYLNIQEIPTSILEWQALLQHYGAPTRFIDFTRSPYVAAYFAFESTNSKSVAIWIADKIAFYQSAVYYFEENHFAFTSEEGYTFSNSTFENIFSHSRTGKLNCIIPVESLSMNTRCYPQQSVFLTPSNPYKSFNEQLSPLNYINTNSLFKIVLPASERGKVLRDLIKMNITRATLFPGLEGFTRSLYNLFSNLSTFDDMGKSVQWLQEHQVLQK
jgi:hypothetical protein